MEIKIDDNGILYCDGIVCNVYASSLGCQNNCPICHIAENIMRSKQVDLFGLVPAPTPKESSFQDCSFCYFKDNCVFNPCSLEMGWHFKKVSNEKSNNKHRK